MSEEKNVEEVTSKDEKKCKCRALVVMTIVSLVMSFAALTLSVLNFNPSLGSQDNGGKKVVISKQFDKGKTLEKAKATGKPVVVFFYTDWCHFCQSFAPTYNKISKDSKIKKNVAVAYVNCEKPENQALIQEYGVQGFPTVYVIKTNGEKVQLDNGTFFNEDSKTVVRDRILEFAE